VTAEVVRQVALLVLLLASACGRIGFDSARLASDGNGDGGDDVASDVAPDAFTICHTGTWSTPQKIAGTVMTSEDADPSISPDELTLTFESNRFGSMARAIWVATRTDRTQGFGTPTLVTELDSSVDEREPSMSADGLSFYFMTMQTGMRQIFTATRANTQSTWSNIKQIAITGDTTVGGGPDISGDGLTLYYQHDLDVAVATRSTTDVDFTFVRLLAEVNVPSTDGNPSVTGDGLELFFDSYRNGPNGSIFTASRSDPSQTFGPVTELSQLYTSIGGIGAGSPEISADGRTLYFGANDGAQIDLYTSTRTCN
jgi:Tol biopolymer transport system component